MAVDLGRIAGQLKADIRFGLRKYAQKPRLVFAIVLTLALGVRVNAAVFSVVYVLVWKPLPLPGSERLVGIYGFDQRTARYLPLSFSDYLRYSASATLFDSLAAYVRLPANITVASGLEEFPSLHLCG